MRRSKPIPAHVIEAERKAARVAWIMELRFQTADRPLLTKTLLWRARRYYDACQFEEGDALLELLPASVVRPFQEWYFNDGTETGPIRFKRSA